MLYIKQVVIHGLRLLGFYFAGGGNGMKGKGRGADRVRGRPNNGGRGADGVRGKVKKGGREADRVRGKVKNGGREGGACKR
ncbi:hypothetical protein SUGI_0674140 [Cryptomeria japonica]|nr:hypothetical protein SUGI_0674140 [Cryptomeria japonica]